MEKEYKNYQRQQVRFQRLIKFALIQEWDIELNIQYFTGLKPWGLP